MSRRAVLASLSVVLGAAALAWIVSRLDFAAVAGVARRAGWTGAAAFCGLSLLILLLQTTGWHVLMRARGWRFPFRVTVESMLMGFALNWVTPSMYLGGEPMRIWHISKRCGRASEEVAATVVVHKFAEFAGFIVALLACLGTMLYVFDLPRGVRMASTAVCAALAILFIALFVAFVGRIPVASALLGILGERGARLRRWAEGTEARIEETFREHRWAFACALLFTGGPAVLIALKPFLFFWFLGIRLSFPEIALIFVLTQLVLALQFTPGGIGLFEGGVLGTFALAGLGAPEAAAYAAVQRLSDVILVSAGIAFASREGAMGFFKGVKPRE